MLKNCWQTNIRNNIRCTVIGYNNCYYIITIVIILLELFHTIHPSLFHNLYARGFPNLQAAQDLMLQFFGGEGVVNVGGGVLPTHSYLRKKPKEKKTYFL